MSYYVTTVTLKLFSAQTRWTTTSSNEEKSVSWVTTEAP